MHLGRSARPELVSNMRLDIFHSSSGLMDIKYAKASIPFNHKLAAFKVVA
jgi:hypothetical protein